MQAGKDFRRYALGRGGGVAEQAFLAEAFARQPRMILRNLGRAGGSAAEREQRQTGDTNPTRSHP